MSIEVQSNVPLAPHTTLRIGGFAKYFVVVKTEEELVDACIWANKKSVNTFVLGGGSNILISDNGFEGLVVLIDIKGREYEKGFDSNGVVVKVNSGELWDDFVEDLVSKGLSGAESLSGIPGKTGGAVVQNIGAYGHEISEIVEKVRFYDTEKEAFEECTGQECKFNYRQSIFKGDFNKIITSVWFGLHKNNEPDLKYKELTEKFAGPKPTVKQIRQAVLEIRKTKSMVVDPSDPNSVSAGSFFKNPVVQKEVFNKVKEKFPDAPNWPQKDGSVKLSAGWLIENSGLPRGYVYKNGKVGLSQKHALAIINKGGACASDVVEFSGFIQEKVKSTFGVKLELEVVFVGFD